MGASLAAMRVLRGASSLLSNGRVLFGNPNPNSNANGRALLLLPSQFVCSRGIASKLFVGGKPSTNYIK